MQMIEGTRFSYLPTWTNFSRTKPYIFNWSLKIIEISALFDRT